MTNLDGYTDEEIQQKLELLNIDSVKIKGMIRSLEVMAADDKRFILQLDPVAPPELKLKVCPLYVSLLNAIGLMKKYEKDLNQEIKQIMVYNIDRKIETQKQIREQLLKGNN